MTGAPNVEEGQKVPVVLDGGRVAGGHDGSLTKGGIEIKKGKLRGVESCGMMCSIEELGSTRDMYPEAPESGIYIFPDDVEVGADAVEVLGLRDAVFEYEVTSNRVDCFSVIGIAREAAATFGKDSILRLLQRPETTRMLQRLYQGRRKESGTLPALLCESGKKYQNRPVTGMDAETTCFRWYPSDQQSGGYYQLCDGRIRTADARI